jgi:hypothetical protein
VENSVENPDLNDANFCGVGTFSALHTYCSNSVYMVKTDMSIVTVRKPSFIGIFAGFGDPRF